MVNIWDYYGAKKIRLTTKNGKVITGRVDSIFDAEETYDQEDSITIATEDGSLIGILASEVEKIDKL